MGANGSRVVRKINESTTGRWYEKYLADMSSPPTCSQPRKDLPVTSHRPRNRTEYLASLSVGQSYTTLFCITVRAVIPLIVDAALRQLGMATSLSPAANGGSMGQPSRISQGNQQPKQGHRQSSVYARITPALTSTRETAKSPATKPKTSKRRRVACKDCRQSKVSMSGRQTLSHLLSH